MEKKVSKNHLSVLFSGFNSFLSYILISRTVYVGLAEKVKKSNRTPILKFCHITTAVVARNKANI
jgi:hypothetical protein